MAAPAFTDPSSSALFDFDDDDNSSEHSKPSDPARSQFEEDVRAAQQISKDASQKKSERERQPSKNTQEIQDAESQEQKQQAERDKLEARMNAFVEQRKGKWHQKTLEGRNFLHFLAYSQEKDRSRHQWITTWAIRQDPKLIGRLMGEMDDESRTPLVAAIAKRNRAFCNAVFKAGLEPQGIERLKPMGESLISECRRHNSDESRGKVRDADMTCLHAALTSGDFLNKSNTKNLNRAFILTTLIEIVPQQMFKIKDSRGLTPLHLAVHYDSCNKPSQVDIVKRLLEKAPEALDVEFKLKVDQGPEQTLSIFQYHQRLRSMAEKKNRQLRQQSLKDEAEQKPKQQQQQQQPQQQRSQQYHDGKTQEKEKKSQKLDEDVKKPSLGVKGSMGPPPVPDPQRPNFLARRDSALFAKPQAHNASQLTSVAPVLGANSSQVGASPKLAPSLALGQVNFSEDERTKASDQISQHLKLLGLRSREPYSAAQFLGNGMKVDDKMLWFDFGPRKKLTESEFKKSFGHLQFDSILHYVAFPQIDLGDRVTGNDNRTNTRKKVKDPAISLFRWLREDVSERRVKKIVRVIVDDFGDHTYVPHSDEGIEKALEGFDVEILDWRRSDICPASLRKIGAQSLREINLYWSGQNPVLRAWSEEDGLCKLSNLKKINVIQIAGIESEDRTDQNVKCFEERIKRTWSGKSCPAVDFSRQALLPNNEIPSGSVQPTILNSHTINSHKWLTCMRKFSQEFREVVQGERMQSRHLPASPHASNPVVIALIDDGTDIHHADLIPQPPFRGGSFDQYMQGSGHRIEPWWYSASGHGTLMARLIAGICPSAEIRVIKLKTISAKNSEKLQIDVQSAIDAIKYATKLDPDIISMSWTVRPAEEDRSKFTAAIQEAAANPRGILMFCAASDQGQFNDVTFPFAGEAKKFRIGAADAMGNVKKQVGDQDKLDFILPGHDVVIDQWYDADVKKDAFNEFEAHSGSSVATALAAGLAALIVECVRLGVIHTTQNSDRQHDPSISITNQDLKKIHDHDAMKIAMEAIGTDANTNRKYLKVWDLFDSATTKLRNYQQNGDFQGQLEVIAGLARHFLKKGT